MQNRKRFQKPPLWTQPMYAGVRVLYFHRDENRKNKYSHTYCGLRYTADIKSVFRTTIGHQTDITRLKIVGIYSNFQIVGHRWMANSTWKWYHANVARDFFLNSSHGRSNSQLLFPACRPVYRPITRMMLASRSWIVVCPYRPVTSCNHTGRRLLASNHMILAAKRLVHFAKLLVHQMFLPIKRSWRPMYAQFHVHGGGSKNPDLHQHWLQPRLPRLRHFELSTQVCWA